ncbi:MAG: PAS domain-containing protein, partial [Melioribacteraceae bacterium]|nr:PAS domain-containing protein [Melioribacteraceae bacterium]
HLIFYNDISKRLKIEAELERTNTAHREVLDTLQDAYFEADPKGFITYCNNALAIAMGYDDKFEIIGKHFRQLVSRKTARDFFFEFQRIV